MRANNAAIKNVLVWIKTMDEKFDVNKKHKNTKIDCLIILINNDGNRLPL